MILELAARTRGVVSNSALRSASLLPAQIQRRLRGGLLVPVHRGVYRVRGAPFDFEARCQAALLTNSRLVVSSRSGCRLHDFATLATPVVELVTASTRAPQVEGCRVRSTVELDASHVMEVRGLRVTTPARSIFDAAAVAGAPTLRRLIHRAVHGRKLVLADLWLMLETLGTQGHRGAARLEAVMEELSDGPPTESVLEDDVIDFLERFGLPTPERQVWFTAADGRRLRVDFFYRAERVVIEAEGRLWHSHPDDFQDDIERKQIYAELGLAAVPVTHFDVRRRRARVAGIIAGVLRDRRGRLAG